MKKLQKKNMKNYHMLFIQLTNVNILCNHSTIFFLSFFFHSTISKQEINLTEYYSVIHRPYSDFVMSY